jgi:hypothetical protein
VTVTVPFRRFPDVQRELVDDLAVLVGADHVAIETPAELAAALPFVRVLRIGGSSDRFNDVAVVEVDVFAATYTDGEPLAEQVRQRLVGPPPPVPRLDRIDCEIAPRELPWGDGTVRRWNATYHITSRRYLAARTGP